MNKRLACIFLSLLVLWSCTEPNTGPSETADKKADIVQLLSLYKQLPEDTLLVRSSANQTPANLFSGLSIDTSLYHFFNEEVPFDFSPEYGLFACYKFNIDASHMGLITRMPGEYVSSSIRLLLVDTSHSGFTIDDSFELAENWGDAGEWFSIDSWLYKNKSGNMEWFCWREFCGESYETEGCSDSLAVFKILNGKIISVSKDSITLSKLKMEFQK